MQVFYCMQVLHASLLLQPSVQLQYFHARLAGVTVTAEIPGFHMSTDIVVLNLDFSGFLGF